MEHGISVYLRILLTLYTVSRIPPVCGKVNSWCGIIDYALVGRNYKTINATKNQKLCYQACLKDSPRCKSANYRPGDQECDLNCASHLDVCAGGRLVEQPGSIYTYTASKLGCDTRLDSTRAAPCNAISASPCTNPHGAEWQLVFKGVAGTGIKLYDLWTSATWDGDLGCNGNYRNETLFNSWNSGQLNIKRVKLSLYNHAEVKVELVFKGRDSEILSWFAKKRLVSSPWGDLTPTAETTVFSSTGWVEQSLFERRFYISRNHTGCKFDSGWLVVVESEGDCSWEQTYGSYPTILYSKQNASIWSDARKDGTLGMADYLTIHINIE